jgi:primosomal protein N'
MIADVVFDVPVDHAFSYRVPDGWSLAPGQRVLAPLRGAARPGMVVAIRSGADETLKLLAGTVDPVPILASVQFEVAEWVAAESLSSLGSTVTALDAEHSDGRSAAPRPPFRLLAGTSARRPGLSTCAASRTRDSHDGERGGSAGRCRSLSAGAVLPDHRGRTKS